MTKPKPAAVEEAGPPNDGEVSPAPPTIAAPFDLMHNGKVFLLGDPVTDPEVIAAFNLPQ